MEQSLEGSTTNHSSSVITPVAKKVTADDLLNMYEAESKAESESVSKEVEKQAKIQEELPKKVLADKLVKTLEQKEPQEKEGGPEQEAKPEDDSQTQEDESVIKSFKAKHGDSELEIPEEAVIPVKVNNKDVSLKVKDAVAAYIRQDEFNRNMDRRVSVVSKKERDLENEISSIKSKAADVIKLSAQGDYLPGVRALAKMAGITSNLDVVELERAMLDNLDSLRKVWTEMSPEQRNAHLAERRAEEAKKELETEREKIRKTETESQLNSKIQQILSDSKMTEAVFWSRFEELASNAVGEGKVFNDPRDIQPEDVINFHRQVEAVTKVDKALGKINPELINQPIADEVIKMVAGEDGLTADDIEKIVRDALNAPSKAVENLNRKVEQANSKGLRTQLKQVSSTQKAKSELDEEMYEHFFGRRNISPR